MTGPGTAGPPRPIAGGDIVATYSDELGEWTAAQITRVTDADPFWRAGIAAVLELDWSGPEPVSVEDLGNLRPLSLTHHSHNGALSHCHFEWLLPRSYKVIGTAELLTDEKSRAYAVGWRVGQQLSSQRRWDQGQRGDDPRRRTFSGAQIGRFARASETFPDLLRVSIENIESLDCSDIPVVFPNAISLSLQGNLGTLSNAATLGGLGQLKALYITDLFGMTAADCVRPDQLLNLEVLALQSVPADYAAAMRVAWKAEVRHGTSVDIRSPRKSDWVEENRDNPLRDWDGRDHISTARYRKSVAQYKATRRAVIQALEASGDRADAATLTELGREFGEAFNRLDGTRSPFIETEEREELFAALSVTVTAAELRYGQRFPHAADALADGVESVRAW